MKNNNLFEEFALWILRSFTEATFETSHGRRCYRYGRFVFTELTDGGVAVKAGNFNQLLKSLEDLQLAAQIAHGIRK